MQLVDDDDDDDDCKPGDPGYPDCQEKSGLISVVVQWSGEVGKCSSACDKANCLYKENEAYSVTLGGSQDETEGKTYEASWRLGSDGKGVAMGEGPMIEYAECTIKEENEECYDIKPIVGDPNHCPYQLPKANCPNEGEETKYLANQEYGITVTPEEGYKFNNSAEKSTYKVKITNSDATPDFASLCKGDAEDTIEIDTTGVSTTGHTISGKGTDSIKVGNRAAGDAIIVGIKVKPSSNAKKWKVVKEPNEPGGMWSFDPASGKGDSDLSVTLGKDMGNDPVCLVAKYEDSSAESNKVCFTFENPTIPGPTIEIKVGSLSATYGGYNPTETTPSVSYSNGTVTVKTAQDVTISGLSVVPSNSSKPWKIKKTGSEESVVTPSSGSGTKAFTVELAKNHFTGGCVYAEYNDGSASSNQVCFNIEGNPEGDYCVINLVGTGDTGGGIYADVSLGGFLSKTAKLNSSNSYKATWSGLRCGKNYTINVTKAANSENTAQTITATASPSSFSNLSGVDNEVKVNFKKEGEGEANKKFTISCSKGQTSKEVKITTVCENFSNLGTSAVYTLKDSSTGVLYMTSALSSDACNTTFSEVPVMPDGVNSINVSATGLPSDVTVSGGSCQIGGGETQNGQIEITSAVDSAGCSTSSYFDIIKAIIHAKGADSKDYTVEHIGNPGVSYSMTVPAGTYNLTYSDFDPTISNPGSYWYNDIVVKGISPSSVNVSANGTAKATITYGCESGSSTGGDTTHNIHLEFRYQIQSCNGSYGSGMNVPGANIHYNLVAIDKTDDSVITLPFTATLNITYPQIGSINVGTKSDWGTTGGDSWSFVSVGSWSPTNQVKYDGIIYKIISASAVRGTWDSSSEPDCGGN